MREISVGYSAMFLQDGSGRTVRAAVILGFLVLIAGGFLFGMPAKGAPVAYVIDVDASRVAFTFDSDIGQIEGRVPIRSARLRLDLKSVARSDVFVELDVAASRASVPFATDAMRGESILHVEQFPRATFQSRSIKQTETGAEISGDLSLRGTTRPLVLDARLFRQPGAETGSFDLLIVELTGQIDRHAFGASGFRELVEPEVAIRIRAFVSAAP